MDVTYKDNIISVGEDTTYYYITDRDAYNQKNYGVDFDIFVSILNQYIGETSRKDCITFENNVLSIAPGFMKIEINFYKKNFTLSKEKILAELEGDKKIKNVFEFLLHNNVCTVNKNVTAELIDFVVPGAADIQKFLRNGAEEKTAGAKVIQKLHKKNENCITKTNIGIAADKVKKYNLLEVGGYLVKYKAYDFRDVHVEKINGRINVDGHIYCKKDISRNLVQELKICELSGERMYSEWFIDTVWHEHELMNRKTAYTMFYRLETDGSHLILYIGGLYGDNDYNSNTSFTSVAEIDKSAHDEYIRQKLKYHGYKIRRDKDAATHADMNNSLNCYGARRRPNIMYTDLFHFDLVNVRLFKK